MARPDLLLGYQQIPIQAQSSTLATPATGFYAENVISGSKALIFQKGSAGTASEFRFDLGVDADSADIKKAVDFCIVGRSDLLYDLVADDIDLKLQASSDDFSSSSETIMQITNLGLDDLIGPNSQDSLMCLGAQSGLWRYWRFRIESTSSLQHIFSKVVFGRWFDFGERGPIYPYEASISKDEKQFNSDSGTIYRSTSGKVRREFSFQWRVTGEVRKEFVNNILPVARYSPVWLYAPNIDFTDPLQGETLVSCWIDSYSIKSVGPTKDNNIISIDFVEDIV